MSQPNFGPAQPTPLFDRFWYFAAERQNIFFRRLEGLPPPWSEDSIFQTYKFTNAYRASDRVSQFLIREVQYCGSQLSEEVFFRTILFKLFNRISTWQLFEHEVKSIEVKTFSIDRYSQILDQAMSRGERIYSAAYVMPIVHNERKKHRGHLLLLERMLKDRVWKKIASATSLENAYGILRSYPMLGPFLAFQYAIDLNYSTLCQFSEMEFVVPGPGAKRGLRKCFSDFGGFSETDLLRKITESQHMSFVARGLYFRSL